MSTRLRPAVNDQRDHVLGSARAEATLVEYGSYACPYCRVANAEIAEVREKLGDRMRYVFRHLPLRGSDLARRAAELVECAATPKEFWHAHVTLMSRSEQLTERDLEAVADDLGLAELPPEELRVRQARAKARVNADEASAHGADVFITPTFFINGRLYRGAWDEVSLSDAILGSLGYRVRLAALDFARWAPSAGVLLLLATILAIVLANSGFAAAFEHFLETNAGFTFGDWQFLLSLREWANDGLLTIFFLVVGLEIKREFTVGHLSERSSAALPVAAAIGGLAVPALMYLALLPSGPWMHGWGVPMSTDTAFAIAIMAMLGSRVPIELRIFLTAAAIVDDIGAVVVVAAFYSGDLHLGYLLASGATVLVLALMNRARIYWVSIYLLVGVVLWFFVHQSGLHSTLAGILLAMFIPTRPPPNLRSLMAQADTIFAAEASHNDEVLRHGPSTPALRALDNIHDRIESPADRLLRRVGPRSSYLVLPLFALANAGVALSLDVIEGHQQLIFAIAIALVLGKPLGILGACALAVRFGVATKPDAYSWRHLAGAGALAGIGFTMSLFIAGEAFSLPSDFAAAKIAVFGASVISAAIGIGILWKGQTHSDNAAVAA